LNVDSNAWNFCAFIELSIIEYGHIAEKIWQVSIIESLIIEQDSCITLQTILIT